MEKTNSVAQQSAWFRQYESEVNSTKNASNGKKKILVFIPILIIGGLIAMMVKNGALQNEQTKGGVYLLAGIGVVMIIMIIALTGKAKKADAAAITRKDLEALFKTPQDAEEFDLQMKTKPLFQVEDRADSLIFATKDYIGTKFKFMGDLTYRFIRISDVRVLHTVQNGNGHVDVEFRGEHNKVLLIWVAEKKEKAEELKSSLENLRLNLDRM